MVSFFSSVLVFVFLSSSLSSAVTYQSVGNSQVAGGMQAGAEDGPLKSADSAGLTVSRQPEIKVRQRSSVTLHFQTIFFFVSLLSISSFKEKARDFISTGTFFCICSTR